MQKKVVTSQLNSTVQEKQDNHYHQMPFKKRYKYCCRYCKHTQKGKKSCVCVVPLSQRRTSIGDNGCQTCHCKGCSIEDFISRGEDPQYKPKKNVNLDEIQQKFDSKNGCCRKCMKAFSKTGKACLCQVPKRVRKGRLEVRGCKICGCQGCNPRDNSDFSDSSRSLSRSEYSSSVSKSEKQKQYNFNNIDNSIIGHAIIVQYGLSPSMLGMGIPQRTSSYIFGKPL